MPVQCCIGTIMCILTDFSLLCVLSGFSHLFCLVFIRKLNSSVLEINRNNGGQVSGSQHSHSLDFGRRLTSHDPYQHPHPSQKQPLSSLPKPALGTSLAAERITSCLMGKSPPLCLLSLCCGESCVKDTNKPVNIDCWFIC